MLSIVECPVCSSKNFKSFLDCKDYTVSHKTFTIVECNSCGFKFTNPRPADTDLGAYYKSEDYISHSNTSKGIISKLYHLVRNYTLSQKEALLRKYVSRGTMLDFGCGTGMFLKTCHDKGWKVIGMEPDAGARKIGVDMGLIIKENKSQLEPEIVDGSLNAISLWHVLEHVTDLKETLEFFQRKLNQKGVLFIALPNYNSADAQHYGPYWAAYDVPRHLYHFDISTVSLLLSKHGFKLIDTAPMKFDSYYVSMLSEQYKNGSPAHLKAFLQGLKSNLKAKQAKDYSSVIYVFSK
ncbi:MAG TPA: class I SAM-dependent methyltransferase [Cyclobacteriaceae bacterium]|nr:class I SAM-dependent methyltransferase [Cyclobacteriaceae bacterium]